MTSRRNCLHEWPPEDAQTRQEADAVYSCIVVYSVHLTCGVRYMLEQGDKMHSINDDDEDEDEDDVVDGDDGSSCCSCCGSVGSSCRCWCWWWRIH